MADAGRHPNIRILANSEVESVEGQAGDFTVTIVRHPRYVNEDLCVGCRTCATYCPYTIQNPFDEYLAPAKAIDIWCPQAVPNVSMVDKKACLFFEGKCKICVQVCEAKAVDFSQKKKKGVMHVGAIIVTPGYQIFDARPLGAYGYGRLKNVLNSLEFERLLNASGPYAGEVLRPSDGKVPRRIAWLQCVGSRDAKRGRNYCSAVCCTYAVKQMMLVKIHYPETQVAIFHNDIRTYGKGFEDFYNRAVQMAGVQFIRKRISSIKERKTSNNLLLRYVGDDHSVKEDEYDMVVLSVGMAPQESNRHLAAVMGLEVDSYGFCKGTSLSADGAAGRPGIFPAGTFTGPMDIPDAISSAGAAAAEAAKLLSGQKWTLTKAKTYPEERAVAGEEPRIGVFLCHCGTNIAGVADVVAITQYASTLADVVHSEHQSLSCSSDSQHKIADIIRHEELNRVVIAACSPSLHESTFREALRDAGLNPYLLAIANIREQCTWVHADPATATRKAQDIVGMAVARARNLSPLQDFALPVTKSGLVLGGGLAGMEAALSLAGQGFEVYLVERSQELGGNLRNTYYSLEADDVQALLVKLKSRVAEEKRITLLIGYELTSFSGFVGNFRSRLTSRDTAHPTMIELDHGVVIVATGGQPAKPSEYRYGESKMIVTQRELEAMIATNALPGNLKHVVMISCVGARNENRPYCGRTCCGDMLNNALKLRQLDENLEVSVFYRDLRSYGLIEDYYLKARDNGIRFTYYDSRNKPEIEITDNGISVTYYNEALRSEEKARCDLVVLTTPIVPVGNEELSQLLRVPLSSDGFFMEAHMKLRPLDFSTQGMFLCGQAHYPKFMPEIVNQARGAALRAASVLSKDEVLCSGAISEVDETKCTGCGLCMKVCPCGALNLRENGTGKVATVTAATCQGCGVCGPACPANCIVIKHSTDDQINAQIDAIAARPREDSDPRILAFLCNWCGGAAADNAGTSRISYAPSIRPIRVMCSGRVDGRSIYRALRQGMDAILIVGCHQVDCRYVSGIDETLRRIPVLKNQLEKIGIDPERVSLNFASAAEGDMFAKIVDRFTEATRRLGHLNLTGDQTAKLLALEEKRTRGRAAERTWAKVGLQGDR
jgi:heterodisulfide reductase subunit A2